MAARHGGGYWAGEKTDAERATESHTEFAKRMLNSKPHTTLADSMGGGTAAAAAGGNIFEQSQSTHRGPTTGKVISITRPEVFGPGTGTRTIMKVLLARGGERTVTADAQGSNTRIAPEIMEGDTVKLQQSGPTHWEWVRVVPVGEKARKKRRVFDLDALLGPEGLQKVHEQFHRIRWDTRPACESKALTQIVSLYKEWAFALWPKASFPMLVSSVERLGSKAILKELVTDIRYGTEVDWESYRAGETEGDKRRAALKANRSANAEAVFNEYAAALQPGIRRAKGEEGDEEDDQQQPQPHGLMDDDLNDDEFDALLGSISGTSGGAAATTFGAATKPAAQATLSSATAIYAANKAAREAEAERKRKAAAGGSVDGDPPAAANAWTAVASKVAAAAKSAAASAQQLEEDLAASAAMHQQQRGGATSGHKRGRRAAVLDDSDDEEADFAPLPSRTQPAADTTADAAMADTAAAAEATAAAAAPNGGAASAEPSSSPASPPPPQGYVRPPPLFL